jgi:hypothetical protein
MSLILSAPAATAPPVADWGLVASTVTPGNGYDSSRLWSPPINCVGADLIVMAICYYDFATGNLLVGDSLGNAYGAVFPDRAVRGNSGGQVYYCFPGSNVSTAQSFFMENFAYGNMCIGAFSGSRGGGSFDQASGSDDMGGNIYTINGGPITPTTPNSLIASSWGADGPSGVPNLTVIPGTIIEVMGRDDYGFGSGLAWYINPSGPVDLTFTTTIPLHPLSSNISFSPAVASRKVRAWR